MKTKLIIFIILALLMPIGYAYAWGGNDNSDRISNDQAGVFSPGYLNAAKQQAYSIVNQNNQPKSWWDNLVDKIKNKTARDVKEDASTKVIPEVKKKTSAASKTTTSYTTTTNTAMVDSLQYNVPIGTGTEQERDASGNLLAEVISGTRHVYVGFGGYSTIGQGVASANSGDIIIVRGGMDYSEDLSIYKSNIRLYGGYNESGIRDTTNSQTRLGNLTLYNTDSVEINGFTIDDINESVPAMLQIFNSSNMKIFNMNFNSNSVWWQTTVANSSVLFANNSFNGGMYGISTEGSTIDLESNTFYGNTMSWAITDSFSLDPTQSVINSRNNNFMSHGAMISASSFISDHDYFTRNPISLGDSSSASINNQVGDINLDFYHSSILGTSVVTIPSTLTSNFFDSLSSDYWRNISSSNIYGNYASSPYASFNRLSGNPLTQDAVSGIFKGLLANKDALSGNMVGDGGGLNKELIARLIDNSLGAQALAIPLDGQNRADQMNIALALANILKNPTDDQKLILDAVESLLADIKDLEDKAGANPELNKAENDLLQMVATCLLAQGVPDLLKAGDIAGIKGIFKDLGQTKDKIMMDYGQSIKPYYSNIVKELSSNLAMLQLKGILSTKITEEELRNLEPKEIDKILEAIRRSNDKSFELEYILQQDAKYRKEYVDPQNKALEANMKLMLTGFTQKISNALEDKR